VQEALDSIVEKKKVTTIIIAHRLSTIRNADTIHVVAEGNLVESGTHPQLMAKLGYYYNLVTKQEGSRNGGEGSSGGTSPNASRHNSEADLTKLDSGVTKIDSLAGSKHIEFKDVVFSYPTRPTKKIMKGFNLSVALGQTVALVGPSGGGKSTTVGLIERFYDPQEGSVEYMGHDIRSLNIRWYRDQIGYVGQEPVLFNDSILNNIKYGCPGATTQEIEEAARQANCHDFIVGFADGYNTMVGERGVQLSGGQKQVSVSRVWEAPFVRICL
jgi:ATP-binding cassette, subfamily B (MDR/TAP), member 1